MESEGLLARYITSLNGPVSNDHHVATDERSLCHCRSASHTKVALRTTVMTRSFPFLVLLSFVAVLVSCSGDRTVSNRFPRRPPLLPDGEDDDNRKSSCPCDNESWCQPIEGPPVREKEIYGFSGTIDMNWTHVTTVAWVTQVPLVCTAHAHGARAILAAPAFDLEHDMPQPELRALWIQKTLNLVRRMYADGIVFDYEEPQSSGSTAMEAYVALIHETRQVFQAVNPSYQISVCIPWSPDNIDGRNFPWLALAAASDLLYVMDYDTRSQIFDACIASANAPYPGMVHGLQRFFDVGLHPQQLVLGVPWYGYRYPCLPGTAADAVYCPIRKVPFRGVNCSDAAGGEVPYSTIRSIYQSTNTTITGGLRRDDNCDAPFFNTVDSASNMVVNQYWYDDAISLRHKYTWARQNNLRGVGPYTFSDVDSSGIDADMWSAFDVFLQDEVVVEQK